MELRHLRFFVAVAEEGSITQAAARRLHTVQPSISRQLHQLKMEVGAKLLERRARGITLTAAGQVFLEHARVMLMQLGAACEAARNAERPEKRGFAVGFVAGQEVLWLSATLRILREEAPGIDITISSLSSPELAHALMQGKMDVAFLRREQNMTGVVYRFLAREPLVVILPTKHRLAKRKAIHPQELAKESFISGSTKLAPALKATIKEYATKAGIMLNEKFDAENISGGMSLVASTGSVTLLPHYVTHMLVPGVVARPLQGTPPMIDLHMGYNNANSSMLLKRLLARADELVERVQEHQRSDAASGPPHK